MLVPLLLLLAPQAPASLPASSPVATQRAEVARCERETGPDSAATATALVRLAIQLCQRNELAEAEAVNSRAHALITRLHGPESLQASYTTSVRGAIAFARREHEAAAADWAAVVRIRERELGAEHAEVAAALNNLASAKSALGDLDAAADLIARAIAIADRIPGPVPQLALSARTTLTSLLHRQGRLDEARRVCEQILGLLAAVPDADPLREAGVRYNLAAILRSGKQHAASKVQASLALGAFRDALGPTHPRTVNARLLLIDCQLGSGEREAGMALARGALEELSAAGKGESLEAALLLLMLAEEEIGRGEWESARGHAEASLRIRETRLHPEHELVRGPLHCLFCCDGKAGKWEECVRWLRREVAIDDRSPALRPQNRAIARAQLALLLAGHGRMADAAACLEPALALHDARADLELPALSEHERLAAARISQQALELYLEITRRETSGSGTDHAVYAHVLRHKGAIARGLLARRSWLQRNATPRQQALLESLADVVARLSASTLACSPRTAADLDELVRERARLERSLSDLTTMAPLPIAATVDQVVAALAEGEVLVDFVLYEETPWRASGKRVGAFVVTRAGGVRRVDLGPWSELGPLIAAHRELCSRRTGAVPSGPLAETTAKALRTRLWDGLGAEVAGARRVLVCPDAGLALLPFATLPGARPGTFLVEEVELHVVLTAHDVLRCSDPARKDELVAVGGIDYGALPPPARERSAALGDALRSFSPLPGSAGEVGALVARFRGASSAGAAHVLLGAEATEGALSALVRGATIVHLATHGFYLDVGASRPGAEDGVRDDLARNGIALAGANRRLPETASDGILTADEAAWLDLTSCRLVTVSACESGLGQVQSGEHLLGLRRALHLAGAARTLTALWRVDDEHTRRWMETFYTALLGEGLAPSAAWLATQRASIARSRAAGGDGAPGVFGAFILEGAR